MSVNGPDFISINLAMQAINKGMPIEKASVEYNIPIFVLSKELSKLQQNKNIGMQDKSYIDENFGKKISLVKGFEQKDRTQVSEDISITLNDVYEQFGGKGEVPERFVQMFKNLAGEDNKIDAKELKSYFTKLRDAAGKDGKLQHEEVNTFAEKRGEYKSNHDVHGIIQVTDDTYEFMADNFISAVVRAYDKKMVEKNIQDNTSYDYKKQLSTTKYPDADLKGAKMTNITKTVDNAGRLVQETYDINGKSVIIKYNSNGKKAASIVTFTDKGKKFTEVKRFWDDGELYETLLLDKNGYLLKETNGGKTTTYPDKYVHADGSSYEIIYKYNGDRKVMAKYTSKEPDGKISSTYEYLYDAKGHEVKSITRNENGEIKQIEETFFNKNDEMTKYITKNQKGEIISSYEYSYNSKGDKTKRIYKDANGTQERRYIYKDTKYGEQTTTTDKSGNKIEVEIPTKDGKITKYYSKDGKLLYLEETIYGENTIYKYKDANGKIIKDEQEVQNLELQFRAEWSDYDNPPVRSKSAKDTLPKAVDLESLS